MSATHLEATNALIIDINTPLKEVTDQYLLACLKANGWNRLKTAQLLGMSVRTIANKIVDLRNQGYEIQQNIEWGTAKHLRDCIRRRKRLTESEETSDACL